MSAFVYVFDVKGVNNEWWHLVAEKSRLIASNRHITVKRVIPFWINHLRAFDRSIARMVINFARLFFLDFQNIPFLRRKQTFWIILDTRSRTISSSRPNRLEQNLPYQNKHISFHTALPLFASSKAYPMCKRETRNTYHNQSVKKLPIKIPHRFLTHVEKSEFDTNEQNLAVTMSPCSLVRVWPLFADFNSIS